VAGAFRIAEGYVEVTADESGYNRAMDRLKSKRHTVGVQLKLDDRDAKTQLDRFARDRSLKVKVDLDQSALSRLRMQDLTVNLIPKIQDAALRRAQTQLDRLTADRTVRILATADTRVAADEIRNLTQRRRVRIGIDVDTRVAADDIANLTRRRTVRVTADADTSAAATRIATLTRDRTVNIRANMSGLGSLTSLASNAGGAAGSIGMLGSRFASLAGAALVALPAVAALGQAIVQMGPAAAVAVPALGSLITMGATLAVGLRGVGDAFKASSALSQQSSTSIAAAARAAETAQLNVARAARSLKEAQVDAARQITEAQARVKDAAEDVRDAEVRAAADRQAALRRVADAERDLTDAVNDAKQAQEDLNNARKEAADQLEDLNSRLAGAQLDQRQAVLDLQDAEEELAAVKAKGATATAEELAQAQLDYDRALQRLKDQQTETERLREETSEANKAGVEGSDTVRDAQDRLADSQRNVGDRTRDVRDAQVEAAQVAKDGAEAVRDAQQRLADAQQGVADAQVAAARQVRSAQESLADAQRAVTAAQEQGATAASKFNDAMAKLSPNARSFVTAVRDMGPAFSDLRMEVQDRMFRGLDVSFTRMATASLPALRSGLGGMAGVLNNMGRGLMDTFTRLANEGLLKKMFDGFTAGMKPLEKVPGQFSEMFVKLGIAAAPAMKRITDGIGNAFTRVGGKLDEAFKSGRLEKTIDKALDLAITFGQVLGDVFGTLGNLMDAAAAGGGDALGGLGAVFKELRRITAMPEVQEALTVIFKALTDIGKLVAGTFGAVLQAVLPLLAKLAPVVSELAQKFAPVLVRLAESLGEALMPIMDALLPVVDDLGDIIVDLVEAVMPLLKPIGDLLAVVIAALAPVLPVVGDIVTLLVGALVTGLKPVIAALIPAVGTFGSLIGQLAPMLVPLYQAFAPLIPVLGQMAAALINLAMSVITPMLPLIVGLAGTMSGVLAGAFNILVPAITTVVGWLTTFANKVSEVVGWIVSKFEWLYDVLVGHSIIPDLVRGIVRWFTSLWTDTKRIYTALKDWLVKTWRDLWNTVRERWNSFWTGLRNAVSGAWRSLRDGVTGLRTSVSNAWNGLWNGARDKVAGIFTTIKDRVGSFKTSMMNAFTTLRDSLGRVWDGLKSKIASPVRYVVGTVYNNGIRRMWNSIAGKINSNITLPTIKLGFNKGGVVPGAGKGDIVPAMLEPGERILSNPQVTQLGGHRAIDAMLGKDQPTKTGGNPGRQEERTRYQGPVQHFDQGGIVGNITTGLGNVVGDVTDWAKDVVVGNLKSVAQKALRSMVSPLIGRIPNTGIGNLMRGLSNKAVDGMMGWFGKEDKKAVGGPGVQKALSWAKTQHGKPYQWGGNGNPSWDCSGLTSAIESVIRGERPHRRWATGSFVGNNGPSGWVRNLNSPYMIGITNSGVGHTAGTIAGVNVESRGGDGVVIGKRARSYKDSMFTSRWGFAPAAKFDSGGLLQPGATMAVNATGRPERILDPQQTALFERLVSSGGAAGGVTIENITVSGTFDFSTPAEQRRAARQLVAAMKEELRQFDRGRA
jgi:phage-related protein